MLFNEGNCLVKGCIDAAVEVRVYVVINAVPGRTWEIMDNVVLDSIQVLLEDYAHQQPDICREQCSWLNGPAFLSEGCLGSKVVSDHWPIIHCWLPVPWPNSFPFALETNVHPFANTPQQVVVSTACWGGRPDSNWSYRDWGVTGPAGRHSVAGWSCLQCLHMWALLQLGKLQVPDWYLMQISLSWW